MRVAIDGAPAAAGAVLADDLVGPLRALGRPVVRVSAGDFLRPAALRFEAGRVDPDAFYGEWLDAGGLRREVLDPLGPAGSGHYLPSLWDAGRDRATRAPYVEAAAEAVLLLDGTFLLTGGLPFDVTVHLRLSLGALARRTPKDDQWSLPAYARYDREVRPGDVADLVVRLDDPVRPALVDRLRACGCCSR